VLQGFGVIALVLIDNPDVAVTGGNTLFVFQSFINL